MQSQLSAKSQIKFDVDSIDERLLTKNEVAGFWLNQYQDT